MVSVIEYPLLYNCKRISINDRNEPYCKYISMLYRLQYCVFPYNDSNVVNMILVTYVKRFSISTVFKIIEIVRGYVLQI